MSAGVVLLLVGVFVLGVGCGVLGLALYAIRWDRRQVLERSRRLWRR